jgi:hypothetical protein
MERSFFARLILRYRLRLALRRMTPLQREVFIALRFRTGTVAGLAETHGLHQDAIPKEFAKALYILVRTLNPPRRNRILRWRR